MTDHYYEYKRLVQKSNAVIEFFFRYCILTVMIKASDELLQKYHDHLSQLIIVRLRLLAPIVITMHIGFNYIDKIAYPHLATFFFQIRCLDSLIVLALVGLTFLKSFKKNAVWIGDICATVFAAGMAYMTFCTDGSHSRYYEGLNLVILGVFFLNPFYVRHNLWIYLIQILFFETAILLNPTTPFNLLNFCYFNYFVGSTALFALLMTKFYSEQHQRAFIHEAHLRINEAKLASMFNKADHLAKTDELTAIHNRRHFFEMLSEKIASCEQNKNTFYLIIFDIDHFKQLNDSYGHPFGDEVLIKVAQMVKNSIRPHDFLGRFGGDEFVLCMEGIPRETLMNRLNKFALNIRTMGLTHQGKSVDVSASFGAAPFKPGCRMTEKSLMEAADAQLLHVKQNARGHVGIAD